MKEKQLVQKIFGKVLVEIRTEKGLKQAELAERSEMDVTYISDLERGLYMPSLLTILKLAEGLDLGLENFASMIDVKLKN